MKAKRIPATDYGKGAVRLTLGPAALRAQCAAAALVLDGAAESSVTEMLRAAVPPVESILRAVEMAERYEAAAQKLRKWSGRFR